MKRVNIQKDVESRQKIASQSTNPTVKVLHTQHIVEPINIETEDAKSQEIQGPETDPGGDTIEDTTQKRGRATKRNLKDVSL